MMTVFHRNEYICITNGHYLEMHVHEVRPHHAHVVTGSKATMVDVRCARFLLRWSSVLLMCMVPPSLSFLVQHRHHHHHLHPSYTLSPRRTNINHNPRHGAYGATNALTRRKSLARRRMDCRPGSLLVIEAGSGDDIMSSSKKRGGKQRQGRGRRDGAGRERGEGGRASTEWGGESRRSRVDQPVKPEFSRNIDTSELTRKAKFFTVEASAEERALLTKRFTVESISSLKAELKVLRAAGRDSRKIKIKGRVTSEISQLCAATLKPFDLPINKEFETVIQEVSLESVESTLWALDEDSQVDDEILEGDPLDIGEITAQALGLSIDPFATHPNHKRGEFDMREITGEDLAKAVDRVSQGAHRFAPKSEEEDVVLDMATMQAFFDADD